MERRCVCVCVCACVHACMWTLCVCVCSVPCCRRFTSNGNSVCRLRVAVDSRFFTNVARSSVASVNNEVTSIFNEVNQIFSNTDFNFDRQPDGIRFSLSVEIYEDPDEPSQAFANDNIPVNEFLDLWSQVRGGVKEQAGSLSL